MRLRKLTLLVLAALLVFAALSLFVGFRYFSASSLFDLGRVKPFTHDWTSLSNNASGSATYGTKPNSNDSGVPTLNGSESSTKPKHGSSSLLEIAPSYIKAIMTPEDDAFPRLACPAPNDDRYTYLRNVSTTTLNPLVLPTYFFALDLHQCVDLLPRLLGSVVETIRFLGPRNCVLSVVEGRSDDGTFEVLKLLQEEIEALGARYFLSTNEVDPKANNSQERIKALAELRNQAMNPLVDRPDQYSTDATVIFLNDVSLCMEDILELVHQRRYQKAEMTCAMDWIYVGPDPTFYDVWVARGMNGDTFFNIPEDGSWDSAWNLFWNNPKAHDRLISGKPFQVFSCWNGVTAFTAKPLLEHKIKFRARFEHECYQGEPQVFCKEMWYHGLGKIAVVPSVNVEYSDEAATKIKALKGYVSKWVEEENSMLEEIEWEKSPPPLIKCMGSYANQTWLPWNNQLAAHDSAT